MFKYILYSLIRYINYAVALDDVSSFINTEISSLNIINNEGAAREHEEAEREHAGKSQFGSPYSVGHSIRDPELAALGSA